MKSGRRPLSRIFVSVAGLALLAVILAACASNPGASRDRQIQERAQARWDAIIAGDYERAFTYLSPGYRSTTNAADYGIELRLRKVRYLSASYLDHSCDDNACSVRVDVGFRLAQPMKGVPEWDGTQTLTEQWVRIGGDWWFLPD
jgi:hypothetical protein